MKREGATVRGEVGERRRKGVASDLLRAGRLQIERQVLEKAQLKVRSGACKRDEANQTEK